MTPSSSSSPDLTPGAALDGADLARAAIRGRSLKGASLRGARLEGAHLTDVDLTGADLGGARLSGATLERVVLDEARLDGVQAAGLTLIGGSLARVRATGLLAAGSHLQGVRLGHVELVDCVLDGAFLEGCEARGVRLRGCSGVALRTLACWAAEVEIEACDLGGAEVLDARLAGLALRGTSLRGARLERVRLEAPTVQDCALAGTVFDRCRGLDRDMEGALREAGALVLLPAAVGAARALAGSRRLQVGLVVTLVLGLAGGAALVLHPALWPDMVLAQRIQAQIEARDCAAMEALGEALGARGAADSRPRLSLFEAVATCRGEAQRVADGEALLREVVEAAGGSRDARRAALTALARYQARFGEDGALDVTFEQALDLAAEPGERLELLRLEESLLRGRGLDVAPRGPGDPEPEDPRWLVLERRLAETLVAVKSPTEERLLGTPADLYVLGEWDLAEGLFAGLGPASSVRLRGQAVDDAARRLVEGGRPDLALALLAHQRTEHPQDPQGAMVLTRREVDILLAEGQIEEAGALVMEAPKDASPALAADLGLLRAAVLEAGGHPREALDLLDRLSMPVPVSFDQVERRAWLYARAWRTLGREQEALEALGPLLTAASTDQVRERLPVITAWAANMSRPEGLLELMGRVENPAFLDGRLAADTALGLVRARGEAGLLTWDDPLLAWLLTGGDGALVAEALAQALAQARAQAAVEPAVAGLSTLVARHPDPAVREAAGLDLAETALAEGHAAGAAAVLDRLGLEASEDPGRRAQAGVVRAGVALRQEDPAQALASVTSLLDDDARSPEHRDLARRVLRTLGDAGRWPEAEALARRLLVGEPEDPDLLADLLVALLAAGRATDLPAALAAAPACTAQVALARAHERRGLAPVSPPDLAAACGPGAAAPLRAEAGRMAANAGDPEAALRITAGLGDDAALDPYNGSMVAVDRARWLDASGRRAEGRAELEARYLDVREPAALGLLAEGWVDLSSDDADALVATYRRCVGDHPDLEGEGLWQRAARGLVALGAEERLAELGGDPAWSEGIAEYTLDTRYRRGREAKDASAAWAALRESLARGPGPDRRRALLDMAADLGGQPGQGEALLTFLDAFGGGEEAARAGELRLSAWLALAEGELARFGEVPKGQRTWRRRLEQARTLAPEGSAERERVEILGLAGDVLEGRSVRAGEERANAAADLLAGWGQAEAAERLRGW